MWHSHCKGAPRSAVGMQFIPTISQTGLQSGTAARDHLDVYLIGTVFKLVMNETASSSACVLLTPSFSKFGLASCCS